MGSGLSMASVNKIKELANQREYSLALDILDSQDLSKSLNPQFLRLCGDIYTRMGRYKEAREVLLMAHKMAPEAKRVIFSLVYLYLKVGYIELAKAYYDIYMFDAEEENMETKLLQYIMDKASGKALEELVDYITPYYAHNLDYDWSYETYLIYTMMGKSKDAESLADDYNATFKNTEHSYNIEKIRNKEVVADDFFFVFAKEQSEDDEPEQEELRIQEKELLRLDDLRIHPIEAEITIMVDDYDEPEFGTKLKMKKLLKKQRKLDELNNEGTEEQSEATDGVEKSDIEETDNDTAPQTEDAQEEEQQTTDGSVKGIIKKFMFKLKKNSDETQLDENQSEEILEEAENSGETQETEETEKNITVEHEEVSKEEDFDMQEIHNSKQNSYSSIVSVDVDDDFTAEADTIDGLSDEDYVNPFDSISAIKKEKEEHIFVPKRKSEVLFESYDIDSSDEEEQEEFEVDDFSDNSNDGFGVMSTELEEDFIEETEEEIPEEEIFEEEIEEEIFEEEVEEEVFEEEIQEEILEEEVEEEIFEEEVEEEVFEEEIQEEIFEEEVEEEIFEEEVEEEIPEEIIEEELFEEEVEEEIPEEIIEEELFEEEVEEEIPEEIIEEEIFEEEIEEEIFEEEIQEEIFEEEIQEEIPEAIIQDIPTKKKLDFPVFRSSLFPNHNAEKKQTTNNFNAIMVEAQDKIQENILKEEQMQREAEALLASLGIDLDSIVVTPDSIESINKTLYNEPSRDELKASLKIDSVKKNILRKLKEYR